MQQVDNTLYHTLPPADPHVDLTTYHTLPTNASEDQSSGSEDDPSSSPEDDQSSNSGDQTLPSRVDDRPDDIAEPHLSLDAPLTEVAELSILQEPFEVITDEDGDVFLYKNGGRYHQTTAFNHRIL